MRLGRVFKQVLTVLAALGVLALILAYMSGAFTRKIEPRPGIVRGAIGAPGDRGAGGNGARAVEPGVTGERTFAPGTPTETVVKVVQTQTVEVVGTIRAERRTDVSSRIMAGILKIAVHAGDRVEKGAALATLDDRDLKAAQEQARQQGVGAQASLKEAETSFGRQKELLAQKVTSKQEYDRAQAVYEVAQAQVEQAREALSAAQAMLSYTVIQSPVSGVVIDRLANEGDTAVPGKPIVTIYDPTALRLEAAVPEAQAAPLHAGDKLEMRLDPRSTTATVSGPISEIVPQAEAASRSVLVKVGIPEATRGLVEGAFGRLLIPTRERIRICVASSAVRDVGQLRFVDVVRKDASLERRQITLGERSPFGRVEALSGLEPGEVVVLHGPPPQPLPPGVRLFEEPREKRP